MSGFHSTNYTIKLMQNIENHRRRFYDLSYLLRSHFYLIILCFLTTSQIRVETWRFSIRFDFSVNVTIEVDIWLLNYF